MSEEGMKQLRELCEQMKNKSSQPCPQCGHCPTCGRGGSLRPWPYYPQPYYTGPVWIFDNTTGPVFDNNMSQWKVTC